MDINKSSFLTKNMSFSGHKKALDKTGYPKHDFYYIYDSNKYNCDLELYNITTDRNGNYSVKGDKPEYTIQMPNGKASVDLYEHNNLNSNQGFAYRFKLTDKKTGKESYAFDNGSVINIFDDKNADNKYNVILNNRAVITKNGPMQLIMPDGYYPGIKRDKNGKLIVDSAKRENAISAVRTHVNKLGGNFNGIIYRLDDLEKEGVARIVGTPFTKDTISSHLYWTENAYQANPELGNEQDFKNLQTELFKHGINWVADAALVNEGFGGIHFSEFLRNGEESVSKNMFRSDGQLSLGILPENTKNTRMKIINSPFVLNDKSALTKNEKYNAAKPTYIQFYDNRLVSEEQESSDELIKTYQNLNASNEYEITKCEDAVCPYAIEVNPDELKRNIQRVGTSGMKELVYSDFDKIKKVANFENFKVVKKSESAGIEVWDGNVDIPKLNFYRCNKDNERFAKLPPNIREEAIKEFDKGTLAVRDYALTSGKYWTKLTDDVQLEHA
ncbi:MAG: hypothetical protein LUG16_00540, partial [Candidatus Gastranaerophilales bacterium]|nr:hypothetical protein [Candidatus Gastranaerophilales bacterium]